MPPHPAAGTYKCHLGIQIQIKIITFARDHPMIIPVDFELNPIS
jgi:hypothetical protein